MRICLSLLFLWCGPSHAAEAFTSGEAAYRWMTTYYIEPEPERVPELVAALEATGYLNHPRTAVANFGFLSGVIADNPDLREGWIESWSEMAPAARGGLVLGVWYANLANGRRMVDQLIGEDAGLRREFAALSEGESLSVRDIPLEQGAWVLDALWANFMATGDAEPVRRIVQTLRWLEGGGDSQLLSIALSARWSLTSNAVQHPRVRQICRGALANVDFLTRRYLEEILAAAEKELAGAGSD